MADAPTSLEHAAPLTAKAAETIPLYALDVLPDAPVELGGLLTVVAVYAANVVRDIRENIRNLVGGRMLHYERLIQDAVDAALVDLQRAAHEKGFDGVVGVKITHPTVVDGGVEVIVYGNGFRWRSPRLPESETSE